MKREGEITNQLIKILSLIHNVEDLEVGLNVLVFVYDSEAGQKLECELFCYSPLCIWKRI